VAVDDDAPGNIGSAVVAVDLQIIARGYVERKDRSLPVDFAGDGLGVRVDEEFVEVESAAVGGIPLAVDPVAIELSGFDVAYKAMPDKGGALAEGDGVCLVSFEVEEAKIDAGRAFGIYGEVRTVAIDSRAKGKGTAGKQCASHALMMQQERGYGV
jgi:hypothetical protein